MKTNATRLLDTANIPYEVRLYEVDPDDLTAVSVARKIGMPPQQVFKTLLTLLDKQPAFAVVAGNAELNLKKLAAVAGTRKAELAPLASVESLTGYVRGGVTVLAAKRAFPVFADSDMASFDRISVSAGARGIQLVLAPQGFLDAIERVTGHAAVLGEISRAVTTEAQR